MLRAPRVLPIEPEMLPIGPEMLPIGPEMMRQTGSLAAMGAMSCCTPWRINGQTQCMLHGRALPPAAPGNGLPEVCCQ